MQDFKNSKTPSKTGGLRRWCMDDGFSIMSIVFQNVPSAAVVVILVNGLEKIVIVVNAAQRWAERTVKKNEK